MYWLSGLDNVKDQLVYFKRKVREALGNIKKIEPSIVNIWETSNNSKMNISFEEEKEIKTFELV